MLFVILFRHVSAAMNSAMENLKSGCKHEKLAFQNTTGIGHVIRQQFRDRMQIAGSLEPLGNVFAEIVLNFVELYEKIVGVYVIWFFGASRLL